MQNNGYNLVNYEEINRDGSSDVLAISIKTKLVKTDKNTFNGVKALMNIRVFKTGDDGKYIDLGFKNRWIDMRFTQDAFDTDKYEGCKISKVMDLKTGTLFVKADYVDAPSVYKVTKDENGKDVYPSVWVRGGIVGFQKLKPQQNAFNYQPSPQDAEVVDEETGEVSYSDEDTSQYTEEETEE